jgi:hypothetical protein
MEIATLRHEHENNQRRVWYGRGMDMDKDMPCAMYMLEAVSVLCVMRWREQGTKEREDWEKRGRRRAGTKPMLRSGRVGLRREALRRRLSLR